MKGHALPVDAQLENDTIVAIATPPGRGGIAVARLSGPEALPIARRIVALHAEPVSHRAHYGAVVDEDGRQVDDAVFTWFAAPRSYTTEDVVEVSTHGSPVVQGLVLQLALRYGARLARPGEFTERAYLRGRLDLSAAEAVRDLIEAQTVAQARLAAEQLGGSLAREVAPLKRMLVELIATLEAGIDFAEDDLETLQDGPTADRIRALLEPMRALEASFGRGRMLREGLKLALVGKPNSGKSSIFNRLLGRDRSIVTPVAGTTRDTVTEDMVIAGVPIHLVDTAGVRATDDQVERLGVQRTWESVAEADLMVHVVDVTDPVRLQLGQGMDGEPRTAPPEERRCPLVTVLNKADLLSPTARVAVEHGESPGASADEGAERTLLASAVTGEGLESLRETIGALARGHGDTHGAATLTNARQHTAAQRTVGALYDALEGIKRGMPHEAVLIDLYAALDGLDALTGQTLPDEILQQIFSTFCIGK